MIILVVGFLLLAAGVSVYYIPSIIRSVSSGDEKPASQPLATGAAKRQTGLSEDIDPFNTAQKKQRNQRKKKSFLLKRLNRRKINSRASAVHLTFLLMAARQETAAVQRERQFHILRPVSQKAIKRMKQKQPHRLQNLRHWRKLRNFHMTQICLSLREHRFPAHWTGVLFLTWRGNWNVRSTAIYTAPVAM